MSNVIPIRTPEERAANVRELLAKHAPKPVAIGTMREAIKWGEEWMAHARRVEAQLMRLQMLLAFATINLKSSDLLLEIAEAELNRLRGNDGKNEPKA